MSAICNLLTAYRIEDESDRLSAIRYPLTEWRMSTMAMDYRRLEVWKKSMLLVKTVYPLIERLPQEEKYALGNQIRRAVTSIVLNIAEGTGRNSDKELRYFLTVARGSTAEVEAQLLICVELGFFSEQDAASALQLCDNVKGMLYRFIERVGSTQ